MRTLSIHGWRESHEIDDDSGGFGESLHFLPDAEVALLCTAMASIEAVALPRSAFGSVTAKLCCCIMLIHLLQFS